MPFRKIGTDLEYALIVFDESGNERREQDGSFLSRAVVQRATNAGSPVTDVFLISHGWLGDVPGAIVQYDAWIAAMAGRQSDLDAARARDRGFVPLIVGLHWPSLPWGNEAVDGGGNMLLSAGGAPESEGLVEAYSQRIAATPAARAAIRTIVDSAAHDPDATSLSAAARTAYATLFAESGLLSDGPVGEPGSDHDGFDPAAIIAEASATVGSQRANEASQLLGVGDRLRDLALMPLRMLSFWKMKDRARRFGEAGANALLGELKIAAPAARFHLMGHSFGCIAMSAAVAGPPNWPQRAQPVDSMFLVQGAMSLWSYAHEIPYAKERTGYFDRVMQSRLVRGPIVTTRSSHDRAVGTFYPLGARLNKQLVLADDFPAYGGTGAFGIQGVTGAAAQALGTSSFAYDFREPSVYNLDASNVICHDAGAEGAHNDIAHPEVAHAFWAAILADQEAPAGFLDFGMIRRELGPRIVANVRGSRDWSKFLGEPATQFANLTAGGSAGNGADDTGDQDTGHEPESPGEQTPRWIVANFEDHPAEEPLNVGGWYTLAFDIDTVDRPSAGSSGLSAEFPNLPLWEAGSNEIALTVQLDSDDFAIADRVRQLILPRVGRSLTKARFDISPLHDGPCSIKATIHRRGNFIQQLESTFSVGIGPAVANQIRSTGRPISAAAVLRPRQISLVIKPSTAGFDCTAMVGVQKDARLPIQPAELASAIDVARKQLELVLTHQNAAGAYVFQNAITISEDDQAFALRVMAEAGAALFRKLFFGPGAGADSNAIGNVLRAMASSKEPLTLQVSARSAPVPWGLLYLGDASTGAQLNWNNFIGMRHIVEQIPLQNSGPPILDNEIPSNQQKLRVSVNVNTAIDAQMHADFVEEQRTFWANESAARPHLEVRERTQRAAVLSALRSAEFDDQIVYFYCHAASRGLTDPGGPDESCLLLADGPITLGQLNLDASTDTPLRSTPLVFINACESAELSPAFYDGFVPYFMAKGARGVIGTECRTPALFAAEWSKRFFGRFLNGEPLGDAFLKLRREFLEQHRNPCGLLYAVHCDADTKIQPALERVAV